MTTDPKDLQFNTSQVAAVYQVSLETVRTWCLEFQKFLSPRANPGNRQKRLFSHDDMEVLALVALLKAEGLTYQDIHLALQNGERAVPPITTLGEQTNLSVGSESGLIVKVQQLESRLVELDKERNHLVKQLDGFKRDALRHEIRAEMLADQLDKSEKRVRELLDERARLEREIGALTANLSHYQQDDDS